MIENFDPTFFNAVKPPDSQYVTDNCVLAFSLDPKSNKPILRHDQHLVNTLLKENGKYHKMEFLSILYDFIHLIDTPFEYVPNDQSFLSDILAVRKLFAIGHFSNQMLRQNCDDFVKAIPPLIRTIMNLFNRYPESAEISICAISNSLSAISLHYKDINKDTPNYQVYFEIADLAVLFSQIPKSIPPQAVALLHNFFLNSLFAFPYDCQMPDYFQNLFFSIIKKVVSAFVEAFNNNFNFVGLSTHLLYFLSSPYYSLEIRFQIFRLIQLIAHKNSIAANFLIEKTNLRLLAQFMSFVINEEHYDFQSTDLVPLPEKSYFQPAGKKLLCYHLIQTQTFEQPVPILKKSERIFNISVHEPVFYNQRPLTPNLNALLVTAQSLCNSADSQHRSITNSHLIKQLISVYGNDVTPTVVLFIFHWIRSILSSKEDFSISLSKLLSSNIFETILDYAFTQFRYKEFIQYVCELFPYLLNKNPDDAMFLNPLFQHFEESIFSSTIEESMFNLVCQCVIIDPLKMMNMFKTSFYDERIASLFLLLRLQHLLAIRQQFPTVSQIEKSRLALFKYVDIMLSFREYSLFLFRSQKFVEALLQMIFELNLQKYVLYQVGEAISILNSSDSTLESIFVFFQSIFSSDETLKPLQEKVLEVITDNLNRNTVEIAKVFLKINFFDTLISFVKTIADQENLFKLLELFRIFSEIRGDMRKYMAEADLFNKLFVLIKPFFVNEPDPLLLGHLWSIVFEDQYGNMKVREIKNATPLSLIFHLHEENQSEFLGLIKFISDCCERFINSILEVNNSDFPSHLVQFLMKYRMCHEITNEFKKVNELFTMISLYSMKGKDLLTLFQLMSALPGNFRPVFSMYMMSGLLSLFQSPYDAPPSFIRMSKDKEIIEDLPFNGNLNLNDFTFFVEIEFINKGESPADIFFIETQNSPEYFNSFRLFYHQSKIHYDMRIKKKSFTGSFSYLVTPNTWNQIAVVHSKRKLHLYVNGTESSKVSISHEITLKNEVSNAYLAKGLICNISSFFLSKLALDKTILGLLYSFPRYFVTSFSPLEKMEFPSEYQPLFESFNWNLVFLCNSALSYNGKLINLSNDGTALAKAQIIGYSPQAKDVMHVVGGIQAILPLFEQLDMPILPDEGKEVNYKIDPDMIMYLLQLLQSMLQKSIDNQEEFYHANGFGILAFLFTRVRMAHFKIQVIEKLRQILQIIEYQNLIEQMISQIFLNAGIWIYFPIEIQRKVYESVHLFYMSLPDKHDISKTDKSDLYTKQKFAHFLPYSKILHLLRVYFWSVETDNKICLWSNPKIDPITSQEIYRCNNTNIQEIRYFFWNNIIQDVLKISFTKKDALTLCTLCFDTKDISLTVDTLTALIMLIFQQKRELIEVLKDSYTFYTFFTLLVSPNELIRSQCIHIFVRFSHLPEQDRQKLLSPFTTSEWMTGIISTISTVSTSTIFADVVFGYLFNLFPTDRFYPVPEIRVSMDSQNTCYDISNPEFLPLAILSICDFEDSIASRYMNALANSAYKNTSHLLSIKDWDHPFIMFLIHRIPDSSVQPDQASRICLRILNVMYMQCKQLQQLQIYLAFFSARTSIDFSHISRLIFTDFTEFVRSQESINTSIQTIYEYHRIIFEFLFLIPDSDPYYLPSFHLSDNKKKDRVTFKDIHQIKYNGETPNISYTYATRTQSDGTWIDADLAEQFLNMMRRINVLFNTKPTVAIKEKQLHPLFMFSFTLGTALQHSKYFQRFVRYIKPLSDLIPKRKLESIYYDCFINFMSGLIKCCQLTEPQHQSHSILYQYSQEFAEVIRVTFEVKSPVEMTLNNFNNDIFKRNGFCSKILTKLTQTEISFASFSAKKTKNQSKVILSLAGSNAHYAEKLSELNIYQSSLDLNKRNELVHYTLLEYASQVRNEQVKYKKQYRDIWRSLSSEGGPWCSPEVKLQHHYKLDSKSILNSFLRGRLIENFGYKDHKDASILRDEGSLEEANQKYEEHLKQLRMSNFKGDTSVVQMGSVQIDKEEDVENQLGQNDEVTLSVAAKLVTMKQIYTGNLMMTKQYLIFESASKYKRIKLSTIKHIFLRKFLLLDTSIEIFTTDYHSFFFDFALHQRSKVISQLKNSKLPNINYFQTSFADVKNELKKFTKNWQNGKLSNFDYLMILNIMSGRTYNDTSQYPVFPWILADYKSEVLDLNDSNSFRDLSIPIGALDQSRLDYMKEKMDPDVHSETHYLYGSFYSSSAVVIGYMIRVEPFTSLHIQLQSGRFDLSDRLFHSIPQAWNSVKKNSMDFRELIPEFFYFPDFLENKSEFDLGRGESNVELPRWANSPADFIIKNRAALESDYVSSHLHEWIDLIFGVNSRGEGAEKTNNLFSPNFFDTAITKEVLERPERLKIVQEFATCFGQAPQQLFTEPHCRKNIQIPHPMPPYQSMAPYYILSGHDLILNLKVPKLASLFNSNGIEIIHVSEANSIASTGKYPNELGFNIVTSDFQLHRPLISKIPKQLPNSHAITQPSDIKKLSNIVKINGNSIAYGFPWDNAIYFQTFENNGVLKGLSSAIKFGAAIAGAAVNVVTGSSSSGSPSAGSFRIKRRAHTRPITAIELSEHYLVSGSEDCTVIVWKLVSSSKGVLLHQHSVLSKHRSAITCIAIDEEADLMVSCSKDGTVVTTALNSGKYLRTIQFSTTASNNNPNESEEVGESLLAIDTPDTTNNNENDNINDNDNKSETNIKINDDDNSSNFGPANDLSKYDNIGKARRESLFKLCSGVPKEVVISQSGYFAVHLSLGEKSTIAFFDENMNIIAVRQTGTKKANMNFNYNSQKSISKDLTIKKDNEDGNIALENDEAEITIEIQETNGDNNSNTKRKHKKLIRKSSSVAAVAANDSEGGIQCWSFFELPDGRMFLIELLRNKSIRMVTVPDFELLWLDKYFNKDISVMHLVQNPLCFLLGTTEGQVYQLSF